MKSNAKKLISVFLAILMLVSVFPAGSLSLFASAADRYILDRPTDDSAGYTITRGGSATVHAYSRQNKIVLVEFTPDKSGLYKFYSDSGDDTYGYVGFLTDEGYEVIAENDDDGVDYNFCVSQELEADLTYYFGVSFYSKSEGDIDVYLDFEDIGSISFTPVEPKTVYEGVYAQRRRTETDISSFTSYYSDLLPFSEGDVLTVTDSEGNTKDYICRETGSEVFSPKSGNDISVSWSSDQDNEPWTVGGDNYFNVSYSGCSVQVPVTVLPNPVESISYEQANPITLTEEVSAGNWQGYYDDNDEYHRTFYHYSVDKWDGNFYGEKPGDRLTVEYTDGTSEVFVVEEGTGWVSETTGERAAGPVSFIITQDDNRHFAPGGENNYITVYYLGKTTLIPVTVQTNPVQSVEYVPAEPILLTEGFSSGYYDYDEIWNDETEDYEYVQWYHYYTAYPHYGDKIIVQNNDGTSESYTYTDPYSVDEDWDDWDWYDCWRNDATGEWLDYNVLRYNGNSPSIYSDQNYYHRFRPGGEYNYFYFYFSGNKVLMPVTVQPNPVQSVEYVPAEPIVLAEGVSNGYYASGEIWNDETEEYEDVQWYRYNAVYPHYGDKIIVQNNDGTSVSYTYTDPCSVDEDWEDCDWCDCWRNDATGEWLNYNVLRHNGDWPDIYSDQSNYYKRFTPGGEYNYFYFYFSGNKVLMPVTVQPNPIGSIGFIPASLDLYEGASDGYYNTDDDGNEYYSYRIYPDQDGNKIILNYTDGTSETFTYHYSDDEDGYWISDSTGKKLDGYVNSSDNQYENHFTPGGEYNYVDYLYAGRTVRVYFNVHENPVESFTFKTPGDGKPIFLTNINEGEFSAKNDVVKQIGSTITIDYTDGSSAVYRYDGTAFVDTEGKSLPYNLGVYMYCGDDDYYYSSSTYVYSYDFAGKIKLTLAGKENVIDVETKRVSSVTCDRSSIAMTSGGNVLYCLSRQDPSFTVTYTDGSSDVWRFIPGSTALISDKGFYHRYYGAFEDDNYWTSGSKAYLHLFDCQLSFNITEPETKPVKSIKYTPAGDVVLTEGVSSGCYNDDGSYYFYDNAYITEGDVLTVTYTDGTTKDFTLRDDAFGYSSGYVADDGEIIFHDETSWNVGQPFVIDDTNYIRVTYKGKTTQYGVYVNSDPVASVEIIPAFPIVIEEHTNGYWDEYEYWDSEQDEYVSEDFWYYYSDAYYNKLFNNGTKIIVNYADGTTDEFTYNQNEFTSASSGKSIEIDGCSHSQYDHPWIVDGEYNYFKVRVLNRYVTVPVAIYEGSLHDHDYVTVVTAEPTCTAEGYTIYTCPICGDSYVADIVGKLAHTPEVIPAIPATCTSEGKTAGSKCSACGKIITEPQTVGKLAHTPEVIPAIPATCTSEGKTEGSKCSVCGVPIIEPQTVAKTAHTPEVIPAIPATCTSEGKTEGSKCSVCGVPIIEPQTVAKTAHTPEVIPAIPATCTSEGKTEGSKCSVCGVPIIEPQTVAKIAHTYTNKVTKASTTKDGKITPTCSACGVTKTATTIAKASGVKLSKTKFVYTGKVLNPALAVKDSAGKKIAAKYYTVTWSNANSKKVGTYTVTVKFKGYYKGSKTLAYTIVPAKVTGLKASKVVTNAITLTWTKATGAKYYEVYGSADGGKTFKKIATPSTNTCMVTKVAGKAIAAGKAYQFKVRALDPTKKLIGAWSTVLKTGSQTAAPKISKLTTKSKQITVTWSKVTGAKSYTVYTSTDGKTYKAAKSGVTKTTCTITGLKGGKKVYVKLISVNAYNVKSAYSGVKSITVKK